MKMRIPRRDTGYIRRDVYWKADERFADNLVYDVYTLSILIIGTWDLVACTANARRRPLCLRVDHSLPNGDATCLYPTNLWIQTVAYWRTATLFSPANKLSTRTKRAQPGTQNMQANASLPCLLPASLPIASYQSLPLSGAWRATCPRCGPRRIHLPILP